MLLCNTTRLMLGFAYLTAMCRGWMGEVAADGKPADADMMDVDAGADAAVKHEPAERPVTRERAVGSGALLRYAASWRAF